METLLILGADLPRPILCEPSLPSARFLLDLCSRAHIFFGKPLLTGGHVFLGPLSLYLRTEQARFIRALQIHPEPALKDLFFAHQIPKPRKLLPSWADVPQ